jgi:hypothetical protein
VPEPAAQRLQIEKGDIDMRVISPATVAGIADAEIVVTTIPQATLHYVPMWFRSFRM